MNRRLRLECSQLPRTVSNSIFNAALIPSLDNKVASRVFFLATESNNRAGCSDSRATNLNSAADNGKKKSEIQSWISTRDDSSWSEVSFLLSCHSSAIWCNILPKPMGTESSRARETAWFSSKRKRSSCQRAELAWRRSWSSVSHSSSSSFFSYTAHSSEPTNNEASGDLTTLTKDYGIPHKLRY